PSAMLDSYLQHKQVVLKNTTKETFAASRKVFLELSQTIFEPEQVCSPTYASLYEAFRATSLAYAEREKE
ncbi:hypothetical protein EC968_000842, partial [Mortierella alpina]